MSRALLVFALSLSCAAADAQIVRDHREQPGPAAQWTIRGPVDSVTMHGLYNVDRKKQLVANGTTVTWTDFRPGMSCQASPPGG
jgi:hypothetical protein